MPTKHDLQETDLDQFIGTENWYQHGLIRRITYTDGVKYMAEHGGAYWLIDEVATNQLLPEVKAEPFQVWKLRKNPEGHGAVLFCEDGNDTIVFEKKIEFTDFPLPEMKLYFCDNVILLPSEY